jgi:hypothetical protein
MKHVASPSEQLEPVRLIAGGGTARERRLLEAAAGDVMPPGTPERLELALSAWAALPAGQGSEPARSALGARLGRWGIVGGLGGLAMVAWMLGRRPDAVAPEVSSPTAPVRVTPVAVTPEPTAQPTTPAVTMAQPAPPTASPGRVAPVLEAKPSRRTRGAASHPSRPAASTAGATLGQRPNPTDSRGNLLEEARRLDAVRSVLDAHDGPMARRELAEYRARFPRGELALEADVLEADLLLLAGEPERARTLANAVLARPDAGRYRQRLEQLLQRAGGLAGSNRAPTNMAEQR